MDQEVSEELKSGPAEKLSHLTAAESGWWPPSFPCGGLGSQNVRTEVVGRVYLGRCKRLSDT